MNEKPDLTLIDTQPLFEKAFSLWTHRAFQTQKARIESMVHHLFQVILEGTLEEKAEAALQLAELAMNEDNLQHFNDNIVKSIVDLLTVPIDKVSLITARTVWILTGLYEIAQKMVELGVIPRLLRMFTTLGMQPLTTREEATSQLNIVGALSSLLTSIPMKKHSKYLPDIAAAMSVASCRHLEEALDLVETENEDGVPDEASTNQYAADTLCLIIHEFPEARQILTYPNAISRLAVNLKSSKTEILRCATVTFSVIVRDPKLRALMSPQEAVGAFEALMEVCEWCLGLLEGTAEHNENNEEKKYEVSSAPEGAAPGKEKCKANVIASHPEAHRFVHEHEIHDVIPSILETAVVSLWGCASVIRRDANLESRATKFLSKDSVATRRRRGTSVEISELTVKIDNDVWPTTFKTLSTLTDPRVDINVNVAATCAIGCMMQEPGFAFSGFNMLTHLLRLLEPWNEVRIRASAAVAFGRMCAAELNLSRSTKPHDSEKWARFCQVMLSGCGIDMLFTCVFAFPERDEDGSHAAFPSLYAPIIVEHPSAKEEEGIEEAKTQVRECDRIAQLLGLRYQFITSPLPVLTTLKTPPIQPPLRLASLVAASYRLRLSHTLHDGTIQGSHGSGSALIPCNAPRVRVRARGPAIRVLRHLVRVAQ